MLNYILQLLKMQDAKLQNEVADQKAQLEAALLAKEAHEVRFVMYTSGVNTLIPNATSQQERATKLGELASV
jgi:hypothetical protein